MNPETNQALRKRLTEINSDIDNTITLLKSSDVEFQKLKTIRDSYKNKIDTLRIEKQKIQEDML